MERLTVLDYSTCEVHIYYVNPEIDIESFLKAEGFDLDEVSYIFGNLRIIDHW